MKAASGAIRVCSSRGQRCVPRNERWVESLYSRIDTASLRCHDDCSYGNEIRGNIAVFGRFRCVAVGKELEHQHRRKGAAGDRRWTGCSVVRPQHRGLTPLPSVKQSAQVWCSCAYGGGGGKCTFELPRYLPEGLKDS